MTAQREERPAGHHADRSPLPAARVPLAFVAVLAALLTFVVAGLGGPPGALDDPQQAYQRDGLLVDGPVLEAAVQGVRFGERPVVLLHLRQAPSPEALAGWASSVPDEADAYVVLPEPAATVLPLPVVVDPSGALADAVQLPRPVDGGRPIGYAVVDSSRAVRYATLDPSWQQNGFEVTTIVGALR